MKADDVTVAPCPGCGHPVEFWPDEPVRRCRKCGHRFLNPENTMKCLNWCAHAAECLSSMASAVGPLREELTERMEGVFGAERDKVEHTLDVLELAEQIGRRTEAEPLVLVPAAILHDLGRSVPDDEADAPTDVMGRRIAAKLLADINLPDAVKSEILDIVEHHHERQSMGTPNAAPLWDADLIVNLEADAREDRLAELQKHALTQPGRLFGRQRLNP